MKALMAFVTVIACSTCMTAFAAFTPPSQDQVNQAAADPAKLSALLVDATPDQAAQVVKAVIVATLSLNLDSTVQSARISQLITSSVGSMAAQSVAFATALGTTLASTRAISQNAVLITTIHAALTTAGGSTQAGTALSTAFQQSFTAALPPPLATDYGQ